MSVIDLMSPEDVAREYPPLTEVRQKQLRDRRVLAYHRLGHRTIVYRRRDIEAFLASCRIASTAEQTSEKGNR